MCCAPPYTPRARSTGADPKGCGLARSTFVEGFHDNRNDRPHQNPHRTRAMITALEAKAALAQRNGLRHTAKSWRDTIVAFSDPILETDNAA